ncbi:MAG: alginate export family protein [Gammaproteobacteria bacterium]
MDIASNSRRLLARAVVGGIFVLSAATAAAEWSTTVGPGIDVEATVDLGFGGFGNWGTNFGVGRLNPHTGESEGDPLYGESYIEPALLFARGFESGHEIYGQVSTVAAVTLGDGDPGGFTSGGDGQIALETAQLGWRSGSLEDAATRPVFEVSVGPQEFDVGDGWLIDDGNFDAGDDGATWLLPRQAFRRAFIGRMDYRRVHVDAFFVEADRDQENTAIAGTNLEYRIGDGHLGLLWFEVVDTDVPNLYAARDGMETLSLRANDLRWRGMPNLAFHAEYTRQMGAGDDGDFEAEAWYGETGYTFATLPWTPTLSYRYAYFSGDADPTDATRREFEPFFYGFDKRGWGTWFQGEIGGGWFLFNANQRNHYVHLNAIPNERWSVGVMGLSFDLAESNYLGAPVTDKHFGDEFNAYADWSVTDSVILSLAYGVMFPGDGGVQALGDDEDFHTLEGAMYLSF